MWGWNSWLAHGSALCQRSSSSLRDQPAGTATLPRININVPFLRLAFHTPHFLPPHLLGFKFPLQPRMVAVTKLLLWSPSCSPWMWSWVTWKVILPHSLGFWSSHREKTALSVYCVLEKKEWVAVTHCNLKCKFMEDKFGKILKSWILCLGICPREMNVPTKIYYS